MSNWLKIKRLDKGLPMPSYQTDGANGIDIYITEDIYIMPNDNEKISFGIAIEIPKNHVGIITTRSGVGFKQSVEHRVGVIDEDYRGELKGKLYNYSKNIVAYNRGDRVAQLLIVPCPQMIIEEVEELSDTKRGEKGFGSSGMK